MTERQKGRPAATGLSPVRLFWKDPRHPAVGGKLRTRSMLSWHVRRRCPISKGRLFCLPNIFDGPLFPPPADPRNGASGERERFLKPFLRRRGLVV
ncbi:MAG: hypothetical protein BAA03_13860 [Caldibacillus debilis]|nr:MAG: hypothetical protein BAA03_13860 [Caldibacillus debilis]